MRSRAAALDGSSPRSDAGQKNSSKYDFVKARQPLQGGQNASLQLARCPGSLACAPADPSSLLQVKVWLGRDRQHHYVLSRYLTCRMLTVTKIKPFKACRTGRRVCWVWCRCARLS